MNEGLFKKGQIPWNKGKKWSEEVKKKISNTNKRKGIKPQVRISGKDIWKIRRQNGTDKVSKETRAKMSISHTGIKYSKETKDKHSKNLKENNPMHNIKLKNNYLKSMKKVWSSSIRNKKIRLSLNKHIKRVGGPGIGKHEKEILDFIEPTFYPFKIKRQYPVAGYFVDGYNKERNIVFEIDEQYHEKQLEKDKRRENIIKEELNCSIIRIPIYKITCAS